VAEAAPGANVDPVFVPVLDASAPVAVAEPLALPSPVFVDVSIPLIPLMLLISLIDIIDMEMVVAASVFMVVLSPSDIVIETV
jgi:hypothetical protein